MLAGPLVVMVSAVFAAFGHGRQAIEIAFVVVAFIAGVAEARSGKDRFHAFAFLLEGTKAGELVTLIHPAEGFRNVIEFADDGMLHLAESDDQSDDQKRADQHQFGGDDKPGFIVEKACNQVFHGSAF